MKLNKTFVLTSLAAGGLIICTGAFGQSASANTPASTSTSGSSHASHGWNMDKLAQQLGLTDAQKEKVQSILASEREQMRNLHENITLPSDQRRLKVSEIRQSADTNLQSVLTPEQYSKWKNMTHHRVMPSARPFAGTNAPAGSGP